MIARDNLLRIETRSAIAQAMQRVVSLRQVGEAVLDGLALRFQDAELGLALVDEQDAMLYPVWASGGGEALRFKKAKGALWGFAETYIRESGAEEPGKEAVLIYRNKEVVGIIVFRKGHTDILPLIDSLALGLSEVACQLADLAHANQLSREMGILNRLAKSLTTALEMDIVLSHTMQGVWELFNVESGNLILLQEGEEPTLEHIDLTRDLGKSIHTPYYPDRGILGHCIANMATALVLDVEQDVIYDAAIDSIQGVDTHSILCAPLSIRDKVFGAILLVNKVDGTFSPHELELLNTLAANVVAALENTRLFTHLTAAKEDLELSREEIIRSRTTLLTLFDNLDDELYIVDHDYNLVAVNQARARRTGKDPKDLVAQPCYEALFGRDTKCTGCRAFETFETGQKIKRIEREWEAGHVSIEREIYTYPIFNETEEITRTILQVRDVTNQRRLETSLIQSEKLAAVGQLAAGVAHELNNPITAVIANAQLLRRQIEISEDDVESLDLIEIAGQRAKQVVRDLLNFSRQERQEYTLVDVNATILHAIALVKQQWSTQGVDLILDLSENMPPIRGNPDHMQSIWLNLVINAHDALEGQPGEVRVRSQSIEGYVIVVVEDTGVGIPPEYLKKVFEPFFTTKAAGQGTGLGLSTTYRIVKQHGGTIEVKSQPDRGTTMMIKIPAVAETVL